jgi:hypothetical protein
LIPFFEFLLHWVGPDNSGLLYQFFGSEIAVPFDVRSSLHLDSLLSGHVQLLLVVGGPSKRLLAVNEVESALRILILGEEKVFGGCWRVSLPTCHWDLQNPLCVLIESIASLLALILLILGACPRFNGFCHGL